MMNTLEMKAKVRLYAARGRALLAQKMQQQSSKDGSKNGGLITNDPSKLVCIEILADFFFFWIWNSILRIPLIFLNCKNAVCGIYNKHPILGSLYTKGSIKGQTNTFKKKNLLFSTNNIMFKNK